MRREKTRERGRKKKEENDGSEENNKEVENLG